MRVWITVLLGLAAGSLVGCSSLAGEYSTGRSKHRWVLQLEDDGRYALEKFPRTAEPERGRWIELERRIVILAPDESATDEHYALVHEEPFPLQLFPTFRAALAAEKAFREVRRDAEGDEQ